MDSVAGHIGGGGRRACPEHIEGSTPRRRPVSRGFNRPMFNRSTQNARASMTITTPGSLVCCREREMGPSSRPTNPAWSCFTPSCGSSRKVCGGVKPLRWPT